MNSIIEKGKRLFFPNGKNSIAALEDVEIVLTNYGGEEIKEFQNLEGQSCTLQEFLKSTGRYSSQYYLYLSTKNKVSDEAKAQDKSFPIEKRIST